MAHYTKSKSSSTSQPYLPSVNNTCEGCPKVSGTTSSSTNNPSTSEILVTTIGQLNDLQKAVKELQKESNKKSSFYQSSTRLNNTVRRVVVILLIVPILQLLFCIGTVYYLGIQDQLPSLINWILGSVGLLSVVELVIGGVKLFGYDKKIEDLEKKIEDLKAGKKN